MNGYQSQASLLLFLPPSLPPSPSNNLNFRLMAIFPAVLAVYGTYQGSKAVTYKLTRRKGRRETIMLLRSFLLSMERMLNLRNVGASEVCPICLCVSVRVSNRFIS
jgi:hypothetical protein